VSNEELVALIQAGDRDRIVELWHQVQRMVYAQATRWAGLGGTTIEDLTQAGFIAMLRAVDTYDPTKAKFSTYLFRRLRAELSAATGYNSKRSWFDPLQSAVSLDAPLTDDDDSDTFADLIPDPAAEAAIEGMDVRLGVAEVLAELPEDQQRAVRGKYWHDLTVDKKTLNAAMKHLRHPDCSRRLKAYL
jgi:RNA polymerase sigma factor (sigma-70 family)